MKYAILNTIDRPYARLVVEIIGNKAYYMSRALEPGLKQYDGMELRHDTTGLEEFGFNFEDNGHSVTFTKVRDSVAKYSNGEIREWQGQAYFTLPKVDLLNGAGA